jgi:predicted dehydrogenase
VSSTIERIQIALVGAGHIGHVHAQTYRGIPTAEVKVVCDINLQAARAVAGIVGAPEVEAEWQAILDRDDIQAVDLCTPEDAHASQILAAVKTGKHVLVEKPITQPDPDYPCSWPSIGARIFSNCKPSQ